ncbi:GAF domain-containing protein [Psychroflexus gondwanensis ACAM 44]|jgi:GAF domain-containing protein|uniref:GAF domain-containing protein n=1 Tax=Psychroflexus gondwanensis ACAM 44 TaxID=1189619 RepID=N1WSC6_9FLAO|nr:GAF domain-containing protein [Psychroflexus gondwanensis]EMY80127.1 GAF domain-containing protein [Psychroflexus gondwanensis ACAM 44]
MTLESLKPRIIDILKQDNLGIDQRLAEVCSILQKDVTTYDWVGFYFKNGDKRELILKAYAGEPTDHTIIPFGKGICGQVAESNQNFVVDDVAAQDNYIACSIYVKSEVVIPLFVDGQNIGQIDIDSHTKNAFSKEDEDFLTWVNAEVSRILEA